MKKGSGIVKRPPSGNVKTREVRLPIKKKTMENIVAMNNVAAAKQRELNEAFANLQNHILPLITEAGLENGKVVRVTEEPPYELVIEVPK